MTPLPATRHGAALTDVGWSMIILWLRHRGLNEPHWRPPGAVLGAVWTIVFATSAGSRLEARRALENIGDRERIIGRRALGADPASGR